MTASKNNNEIFFTDKFKQRIYNYICKKGKKRDFVPINSNLQAKSGNIFYLQKNFVFF